MAHFDSNFIMSRILLTDEPTQIGCVYLEAGGIIGFHQALSAQLLLVVHGPASVRCDSESEVCVSVGDAVFWEKGEWHETKTETGLMAIVIESEALNPTKYMPVKLIKD
ncbi:cupin [Alicyclobacillus fodiniaquatilis]|uniref:Cupin n=1 Tax=Alicyclobacillus fodiniaquatilis TaxID=1661150 RepID=A0ABW4JM54_9BACL